MKKQSSLKQEKLKQHHCRVCGRFCKKIDGLLEEKWVCPKAYYCQTGSSDDGWEHD